MKKCFLLSCSILFFVPFFINAQSTYEQVHTLFQTKCTPSCHSGATPTGNMDLSGSLTDVYNRLVDVTPSNSAAAAKGYKRIMPGYPTRSLLLKKVNHGLDPQNELASDEGSPMPFYSTPLANEEIELIRQWIIWGAKDTGVIYNAHLIHDFYNGDSLPVQAVPLTPEQEGREGYQVKFGPVFVEPGGEFEFFQLYDPKLPMDKEVISMKAIISPTSHHWVLRSVDSSGATTFGSAPKTGNDISAQIFVFTHCEMWGIWQFSGDIDLPPGTAIFQDSAEALLLNLHIPNYSNNKILAATTYANIYTRDKQPNTIEMKTGLSSYGGFDPYQLIIPNTGQPVTLQNHFTAPGENINLWTIQAHSHSLGTDFDMFLRNSDGTKGAQIYEGFYNPDYTINQGYYDYSHPPVRTFDPMMPVNLTDGMIFEATWVNNGPDTMGFGLTTKEEMFVTYFQYTTELPTTAVNETSENGFAFSVAPNPARDNFKINYKLKKNAAMKIELLNAIGSRVETIINAEQAAGDYHLPVDLSDKQLSPGVYFLTVSVDGNVSTKQLVITR